MLIYGLAAAAAIAASAGAGTVDFAQLTVRQRIVVRVPALPVTSPNGVKPRALHWKETKGPKCLPMNALAGASVTRADAVDLVLRGGARIRAQLADECPALDYYSGFYITPTSDGRVCADRDMIHDRSGSMCEIERFRTLVPQR